MTFNRPFMAQTSRCSCQLGPYGRQPSLHTVLPAAGRSSGWRPDRTASQRHVWCSAEPDETVGVKTLLARDRRTLDDKLPDAFSDSASSEPATLLDAVVEASASADSQESNEDAEQSSTRSGGATTPAQQAAAKASPSGRKPKSQADIALDQLAQSVPTRMTCGEAIKQGTAAFQAGKHEAALELFQQALELPGNGFFRLAGTVREYRCASEAEENAALYNMACVYAQMGSKDSALTCLEAALENNFSEFQTLRTDPDLQPVRGPEFDQLLGKYDGLFAKVFKRKPKDGQSKPWVLW